MIAQPLTKNTIAQSTTQKHDRQSSPSPKHDHPTIQNAIAQSPTQNAIAQPPTKNTIAQSSPSPKTRSPNHPQKHDRPIPHKNTISQPSPKNTISQPPTKKHDRPITHSKTRSPNPHYLVRSTNSCSSFIKAKSFSFRAHAHPLISLLIPIAFCRF